jgi:hypothetical protein
MASVTVAVIIAARVRLTDLTVVAMIVTDAAIPRLTWRCKVAVTATCAARILPIVLCTLTVATIDAARARTLCRIAVTVAVTATEAANGAGCILRNNVPVTIISAVSVRWACLLTVPVTFTRPVIIFVIAFWVVPVTTMLAARSSGYWIAEDVITYPAVWRGTGPKCPWW